MPKRKKAQYILSNVLIPNIFNVLQNNSVSFIFYNSFILPSQPPVLTFSSSPYKNVLKVSPKISNFHANLHFYWDLKMHNSALRFELRVGIPEEIFLCTQVGKFSSHSFTYWTNNFSLLYHSGLKMGLSFSDNNPRNL